MTSYTTPDQMAAYLATTFTPEQEAQAQLGADAVTAWIDHRTGRTWQGSGAITGEVDKVSASWVWLQVTPALSVEAVAVRGAFNAWTPLDPSQYELVNPESGWLAVGPGYDGAFVRVDYTAETATPPADLAHAATVLASDLLGPTLDPDTAGLDSLSVGQNDITVKFSASGAGVDGGSNSAIAVVDSYRRVVLA